MCSEYYSFFPSNRYSTALSSSVHFQNSASVLLPCEDLLSHRQLIWSPCLVDLSCSLLSPIPISLGKLQLPFIYLYRKERCFWTGNGINRVKGKNSKVRRRNSVSSEEETVVSAYAELDADSAAENWKHYTWTWGTPAKTQGEDLGVWTHYSWRKNPERAQTSEKANNILEMEATGRQGDKK